MPITIHPKPGQILLCDFSQGFRKPEMVKAKRPVIILTPAMKNRTELVTVVPLSTVKPNQTMPYHYQIPRNSMPQTSMFQNSDSWIKGDMIYTVGFHRLNLILLGQRDPATGKRKYFKNRLSREMMKEVYSCVLHGLNMGKLIDHL